MPEATLSKVVGERRSLSSTSLASRVCVCVCVCAQYGFDLLSSCRGGYVAYN